MSDPKILTVIQTRTGSSRFPMKTLKLLGGKPLFVRLAERVKRAKLTGHVLIATTFMPEDDIIDSICMANSISCFRGHPTDLLDRHYQAGIDYGAEAVVKIPSDCPLIDVSLIDEVIGFYLHNYGKYHYVSNLHPATHPDGNDVEIMSMESLERAWRCAQRDLEREHTTPYIWENPDVFRIANVFYSGGNLSKSHRWCLDYPEDYLFIKAVYNELSPSNPFFGIEDILALLQRKPELQKINEKYRGVNWYRHHLHELKTITAEDTLCPV